jgi:hypothetical protein
MTHWESLLATADTVTISSPEASCGFSLFVSIRQAVLSTKCSPTCPLVPPPRVSPAPFLACGLRYSALRSGDQLRLRFGLAVEV